MVYGGVSEVIHIWSWYARPGLWAPLSTLWVLVFHFSWSPIDFWNHERVLPRNFRFRRRSQFSFDCSPLSAVSGTFLLHKKKYSKISRSRIPDSRSQICRIDFWDYRASVYQVVFTKARDSSINALSMKYTRQGMQKQCHSRKCHPNAHSIDCRLKGEESCVTEIKQKG